MHNVVCWYVAAENRAFTSYVEKEKAMRQHFVQALALALLVTGNMSAARAQNQMPEPTPSFRMVRRPLPVNTTYAIRVINAAESAYRHSRRRFGTWQELYDSGALRDVQRTVEDWRRVSFATGPEAILGYRLNLLVSADGSAYSISLRDTGSKGCGLSLFSDQSGLIYQGTPLGCSKTVDWLQYPR